MKKTVCFVDDDNEEVRRFRKHMGDRYIVGAGVTLDDALKELKGKRVDRPDLFLFDLYYGPDTSQKERAEIAAADDQLCVAEEKFRQLLAAAKQSPEGGFKLADEAQRQYSGVPRAFFSRKAFLQDALRAQEVGVPLLKKPDPNPDDEGTTSERYDDAFRRHADEIVRSIDRIISLNTWWAQNRGRVEGFATGFFFFLVKVIWDLWK